MKKSQSIPQPLGTVPYHVQKSDTLVSIAAQCDVSVTLLKKLNRLMTEVIFPNQVLYVPGSDFAFSNSGNPSSSTEKAAPESQSSVSIPAKPAGSPQSELSTSPPIKPFPGHAERQAVPVVKPLVLPRALSEEEVKKIDEECHERFVKMNAKYIESSNEEIPGILLVTPDAVMFDADENHPLVLQNGRETFQLVVAIPHVMVVTVYHGTSTIRCGRITADEIPAMNADENSLQKTLSCSDSMELKSTNVKPDQHTTFDVSSEAEQKNTADASSHHSSPVEPLVAAGNVEEKLYDIDAGNASQGPGKVAKDWQTSDGDVGMGDLGSEEIKRDGVPEADGLERSDSSQLKTKEPDVHGDKGNAPDGKEGQDSPAVDHALPSGDSENGRVAAGISAPSQEEQDLGQKRTVDEKNGSESDGVSVGGQIKASLQSLGTSGTEALHRGQFAEQTEKLKTPLTAEVVTIPEKDRGLVSSRPEAPLTVFLHLKIDRGIDTLFSDSPTSFCNQFPVKSEYWYSIPVDKVDLLYAFFVQWTAEDDRAKGFLAVKTDSVVDYKKYNTLDGQKLVCEIVKDWELINAKEYKRMQSEEEIRQLPLPDLIGQSAIMATSHIAVLLCHLPPIAEGSPWNLVYSASQHGFSLSTLYRKMAQVDSPVLLIIKDLSDQVFGAMISCTLKMSDHFYGSGETYLFTFYPEFKKFTWTGVNSFFVKGNKESLVIGASEGSNGLWLDGSLFRGRTQPCQTFNNELLTISQDFTIKNLETWCF